MYGTPIQIRVMDDSLTISNRCILPENWTVDTLMEVHDSIPYNPDIANVFFRAGFIENWVQGIQKICKECRDIGADLPEYEMVGTTLRIRFKALDRALIDQPKVPKGQNEPLDGPLGEPKENLLTDKIVNVLRGKPKATYEELMTELGVSRSTIKRAMGNLVDDGRINRAGGKRYGHWEIKE